MRRLSFKRHRFPPTVIRYAVWLYFRFTLSFRDVEELLAPRGIEVSYETIRCWTIKFGHQIAANLNRAVAWCHLLDGISMRWSVRSQGNAGFCGVPSMMRASFWI